MHVVRPEAEDHRNIRRDAPHTWSKGGMKKRQWFGGKPWQECQKVSVASSNLHMTVSGPAFGTVQFFILKVDETPTFPDDFI